MGDRNPYLMKFDLNGDTLWTKLYATRLGSDDYIRSLCCYGKESLYPVLAEALRLY